MWSYLYLVFADHVTLNFARSGGPGGQNVNKGVTSFLTPFTVLCIVVSGYVDVSMLIVYFICTNSFSVNTKVDMRFNVKNAYWLNDRIREKILQTVCFYSIIIPLQNYEYE